MSEKQTRMPVLFQGQTDSSFHFVFLFLYFSNLGDAENITRIVPHGFTYEKSAVSHGVAIVTSQGVGSSARHQCSKIADDHYLQLLQ